MPDARRWEIETWVMKFTNTCGYRYESETHDKGDFIDREMDGGWARQPKSTYTFVPQ
jgi:hypothetical protein